MSYFAVIFAVIAMILSGCGKKGFTTSADDAFDDGDQISSQLTSMTVSPQTTADGVSRAQVKIIYKNHRSQPLTGISMALSVSGSGNSLVPCTVSDQTGTSLCYLMSTYPETKTISIIGGLTLSKQTVFVPMIHSVSTFEIGPTGSYQQAPSGQRLIVSVGSSLTVVKGTDGNGTRRLNSGFAGLAWKD